MPLDRRQIAVTFGQGLDTKSDPKQVQGKVLALENGVFTSPGRIKKRNGYKKVGAVLSGAQMVAEYGDELVAADGKSLYSYSSATSSWQSVGSCRSVGISRVPVWRESWAYDPSSATLSGKTLTTYLYQDPAASSSVYYVVTDASTGQQLLTQTLVSGSATHGRVATVGTKFVIFYRRSGGVYYRVADVATPGTLGSEQTLDAAGVAFDIAYSSVVSRLYVSWGNATQVKAAYLNTSAVLSSPVTIGTYGTYCNAIGMWIDDGGGNPLVAFALNGGSIKLTILTTELSVTAGPDEIEATPGGGGVGDPTFVTSLIGYSSLSVGQVFYGVHGSATWFDSFSSPVWTRTAAFTASSRTAPWTWRRTVIPYSKIHTDADGHKIFVAVYPFSGMSASSNYACYYVMDELGYVHGRIGQQDAFCGYGAYDSPPRSVLSSGTSSFSCPVSVATRITTTGATTTSSAFTYIVVTSGVDLATVDLVNTTNRYQTAQLGDTLFVNGGMLRQYDGSTCVEQGFHYPPIGLAASAVAGSGLSVGDYHYQALYEWTDAIGNVHQSSPTQPVKLTIAAGASQKASITVPTLGLTEKTNVTIRIYRTVANGNVYYAVNGPATGVTANDATVNTVTYLDTLSDADLQNAPGLYIESEVPNIAGPPMDNLVVYRNRVMGAWSEQPDAVWYSKQAVPGTAVAFNDTFVMNIDPTNGPVTAMGWLDDKIAIFKRDVIFYVTGTGPAPDGTQNDFSTPIVINTNSGCIAPKSVVTADDGIMYQSAKGIYLLTRGLEDAYIGAGVESHNSASVVSTVMCPNTNEVRFALDSGVVLVWDYFVKQWSTFTKYSAEAIASACAYQNVFAYLSAGQVWQENPGVYLDDTHTFSLRVKTAWIQLAGLQGFQRVYKVLILGNYASAHTLNARVYHDFADTIMQWSDFTPTLTKPYQYRLFLMYQKCEAIQLEIFDTAATGTSEAFDLSALSLEIGVKRGLRKMDSARSA